MKRATKWDFFEHSLTLTETPCIIKLFIIITLFKILQVGKKHTIVKYLTQLFKAIKSNNI